MSAPRRHKAGPVQHSVPDSVTINGVRLREDGQLHSVVVKSDFTMIVDGSERQTPLTFSTIKGFDVDMSDHGKEFDRLRQLVQGQVEPANPVNFESVYESKEVVGLFALVRRNSSHYITSIRLPMTREQYDRELQEDLLDPDS